MYSSPGSIALLGKRQAAATAVNNEANTQKGIAAQGKHVGAKGTAEFNLANEGIGADNAAAGVDAGAAKDGFGLMASHVHKALSGYVPWSVAESQNPDGTTNKHIAALGAGYMAAGAAGGWLKGEAQNFLNKPGGTAKPSGESSGESKTAGDPAAEPKPSADPVDPAAGTGAAAETAGTGTGEGATEVAANIAGDGIVADVVADIAEGAVVLL